MRCGAKGFTMAHLKRCKARNEKCNKCGKPGHFARFCRTKRTEEKQFSKRVQVVKKSHGWDSSTSEDEEEGIQVLHLEDNKDEKSKPFVLQGRLNGKRFNVLIDTGSPVTIFTRQHVKTPFGKNYPIRELESNEHYIDFNKQKIQFVGATDAKLECGAKTMQKARLLRATEGTRSIVGRDWIHALGLKLKMDQSKKLIANIEGRSNYKLYQEYKKLFTREGKVKGYKINAEFNKDCKPTQQKGRRIPLQIQESVTKELEELIKNGHIEKISKIKDDVFIQPTVITVKRDKTVKIALDARVMNSQIKKDKYQMPNLEDLTNSLAETIKTGEKGKIWFSSVDLKYAYGQVELNEELAKHCNFAIIGGNASGICRYKTGFYGLTVIPTEFQRIIEEILINNPNVFIFIDDILIVTKGTKEEYEAEVQKIFDKLDENTLRLKWEKCKIAQEKIEWLGFEISDPGIVPQNDKVQAITERLKPKNLKELRSYLGAINQLAKFLPNLAQTTHGSRDLLKTNCEYKWTKEHDKTFEKIQNSLKDIIKLNLFDRTCKLRIISDASKQGLGSMLLQEEETGWKPIACASRYLNQYEMKYSINELELLAVVWSVECFRNYIYVQLYLYNLK